METNDRSSKIKTTADLFAEEDKYLLFMGIGYKYTHRLAANKKPRTALQARGLIEILFIIG